MLLSLSLLTAQCAVSPAAFIRTRKSAATMASAATLAIQIRHGTTVADQPGGD
jgi:hypothetical protein